jgi:hypothetical protein
MAGEDGGVRIVALRWAATPSWLTIASTIGRARPVSAAGHYRWTVVESSRLPLRPHSALGYVVAMIIAARQRFADLSSGQKEDVIGPVDTAVCNEPFAELQQETRKLATPL